MILLTLGVLLWSLAHLFPVFLPDLRAGVISQIGENAYKGIFSLIVVGSLAMIIFGWRAAGGDADQVSEYWMRHVTYAFLLVSMILFGAAKTKSRIRKFVRNPMLAGVVVWAVGHLLVNNDPRSLVLFGGMLIWSVLSIIGGNRREGAYSPPEPWSWARDIRLVLISAGIYVALVFGHPYFTGISLF